MSDDKQEKIPVMILKPKRMAMLVALFMAPSRGLLAVQFHRCWVPAMLCILLFLGIASCQRSCRMMKQIRPQVSAIVTSVAKDVAPLDFRKNGLYFDGIASYPYRLSVRGWQLDILEDGAKPVMPKQQDATQGLVFTRTQILYWMKNGSHNTVSRIIADTEQMQRICSIFHTQGQEKLSGEDMQSLADVFCTMSIPFLAVFVFFSLLFVVFLTYAMFLAAMLLMRRETRCSKINTMVLVINCLLPPTAISCVWYMFVPMSFDFSHVFLLATVAYLFVIFWGSKLTRTSHSEEEE